ncbi:MAG: PEP-CTERM sorting domain-containing protein [Verrucomicrobiota bacterium]
MKAVLVVVLLTGLSVTSGWSQLITDFTGIPSGNAQFGWSWTTADRELSGTNSSSGTFGGFPGGVNIDANTAFFALTADATTFSGDEVSGPFRLTVTDENAAFLEAQFNFNDFTSGPTTVFAPVVSSGGTFSGLNVDFLFSANGPVPGAPSFTFVMTELSASLVPEPSSSLLLMTAGGLLLLGRRRRVS